MIAGPGSALKDGAQTDAPAAVSVVIVTHNSRCCVSQCVTAAVDGSAEIIIVDSGSRDGTVEHVELTHSQAEVIALDNVGFGAAANVGISRSAHPYVLVLNADAWPLPGALRGITQVATANPRAALIGPKLLRLDGSEQRSVFATPPGPISLVAWVACPRFVSWLYTILRMWVAWGTLPRGRSSSAEGCELGPREYVQGSAMLLQREAILGIGGFDEDFFMYCEEADLAARLHASGLATLFAPQCEFVHLGGMSTSQQPDQMYAQLIRAHLRLLGKQRGSRAAARASRLILAVLRARALLRLIDRDRYLGVRAELSDEHPGRHPHGP
jgi:GT2 family glycosyltransferase